MIIPDFIVFCYDIYCSIWKYENTIVFEQHEQVTGEDYNEKFPSHNCI